MKNNLLAIKWRTQSKLYEQLTEQEADWLFNEDSLTQRLTTVSQQQFSIEVLLEEWQILRPDEYQKLAAPIDKKGWVREVFLKGGGEPWVYARSVALQTDLKNDQYDLTNIGEKSLGSILFIDKTFQRTPLEATRYPVELLPTTHQFQNLWGRWSSFINEEVNVIVQEIFLPAFWQKLEIKKSGQ
ncbi:chorismate lyase [Entomomonas sp. E2T0]|uniref:chorismate--pyruvate lyase family protein n=1 Tax=Entomomonas sp. E2T0 TaxID=2930213 RepID=UPI0022284888|nr:chorismate lyase [Entomomonas sp. E2T0]UYZ84481.1 chorismate lyase [Entomomonas sp. E2T0]